MAVSKAFKRLPLVGVIGGEDPSGCARLVGRELMKNKCVLLTGGCPIDGRNETKIAAIMGALDAEQHGEGTARFIGVMPNSSKSIFSYESLTPKQLIIHTGLSSLDRDPINGTMPDVLVCFSGGPGTICELAFGIAVGREAIFHGHCAQTLLDKCTGSRRTEIQRTLSQVTAKWKPYLELPEGDGNAIMAVVTEYLPKAVDREPLTSATGIVQAVLQILPRQLSVIPNFPGVLDSHCKQQQQRSFATYWTALSNDSIQE